MKRIQLGRYEIRVYKWGEWHKRKARFFVGAQGAFPKTPNAFCCGINIRRTSIEFAITSKSNTVTTYECFLQPVFSWTLHGDKAQTYSQFMDDIKHNNCPHCSDTSRTRCREENENTRRKHANA